MTSASLAFADVSLREAAHDFLIGVAANTNRFDSEAYLEATSQFNYMVAENGCKLSGIQYNQGVFDFSDCDAHYNKAVELGMKFRGHCLVWHSYQPQWFQDLKGEDLRKAIVEHITKVLTHYKGKIDTWDVVNEAIDDDDQGGWTLANNFINNEVPDLIELAFKTAREVDPSVKLFYNDFKRIKSVYTFVKDMKERGVPIDGVGWQYHVNIARYHKYEDVLDIMKKFGEIGVEVQITEMDVNGITEANDQDFELEAKIYEEALRACLNSGNCTGFLVWGVGDTDSWINGYPLLFDKNYAPKPAYYSLINVLKEYNGDDKEYDAEESEEGSSVEIIDDTTVTETVEDSEY
ncbi:glycoside hydrolase [Neocallimastix californiae]|uniref:Beta-xylanase n=1 Tax=Neocallimastix californiae TaxID=1754190 RepID=A0A1Y2C6N9_9FUNG|nr:glycoside hydrolase [Neocallimastix californiae]|eukprot:ORY42703.1 glycoside hydrolase [Neocallimastix californiae]